jgi:PAS domain S-box-containing protein
MNINEDSNEYYRHFFQGAKVAMLLIDPFDGQIVDANAAAELFYGYSLCQLRNMNIGQINMLSIEQINTEISSATQDKKSFFNFRHKLANGNVRDVEVYSGLIKLSSHPLLYSIVHDITDRKKLEKKLELSEKKFHLIFEAANDCIELISMEGQIVDLNRNGYEQLGYTKEEMQGKHLAEFGSAESIENIPERMESIQKLGSYMFESSRIRKDGATIPIEVSSRLIELDEQPFYLSISRDITERKRAENALRKSEIRHQSLFVNMLDGYA